MIFINFNCISLLYGLLHTGAKGSMCETLNRYDIKGWLGPPGCEYSTKLTDFFYFTIRSEASKNKKNNQSGLSTKLTCMENVNKKATREEIGIRIYDGIHKDVKCDKKIFFENINNFYKQELQNPKASECWPEGSHDSNKVFFEWITCGCIFFIKIEGGEKEIISNLCKN